MSLPDWLILDIRLIKLRHDVKDLVLTVEGEDAYVCFSFSYGEYAQASSLLLNPEPVKLRYKVTNFPSVPEILSNRPDFPRRVPHLNPVDDGELASICLWRKGGNSSLYMQKGIGACLDVLKEWFEDASTDRLQHDGWEPTPRGGLISLNIRLNDWQDIAVSAKETGKVLSLPSNILVEPLPNKKLLGWVVPDLKQRKIVSDNRDIMKPFSFKQVCKIRTLFITPETDYVEDEHNPINLNCIGDLASYSDTPQLQSFIKYLKSGRKRKGKSACVLAIAQRRPMSLIKEIPALSLDVNASRIEITSILIVHESDKFELYPIQIKSPVSSQLLESVSGIEVSPRRIGIIGCGSVGGSITDCLVRSGYTDFSLWDSDLFEPHNNARHVLHQNSLDQAVSSLEYKVFKLRDRMHDINPEVSVTVHDNFGESNANTLKGDHVIDATGEAIEAGWVEKIMVPYSRIFIADSGRLGFCFTQIPDGLADMLDIEAALILMASSNVYIREWLARDSQLADKILGLGCSSSTVEMPWFRISNHTTALMPNLLSVLKEPTTSVVMNVQDEYGKPLGLTEFDTSSLSFCFEKEEVSDNDGNRWVVTLSEEVKKNILRVREKHLPSEAAGYLLGLYNINTRRISISAATEGKFSSSSTSATLGGVQSDMATQSLLEASNGMLRILGTWHSHPGRSAAPSNRDLITFGEIAGCNERVIPSLMLICAESEIKVRVGLNRDL